MDQEDSSLSLTEEHPCCATKMTTGRVLQPDLQPPANFTVLTCFCRLLPPSPVTKIKEKLRYSTIIKMFAAYNSNERLFIFPVASCISHLQKDSQLTVDKAASNAEKLSMPGFQIKKKSAGEHQPVSELEIKQYLDKETGMDRIRSMYAFSRDEMFLQEETQIMNKLWLRTVLVGFCFNLISSSLPKNKKEKNMSMTAGVQKNYDSVVPRPAFKGVFMKTFRLSIWTASLIYISQTIAAYRNKTSVWEYTIASAIGFGSIGLPGGILKLTSFTAGGAVLGLIGGQLFCKLLTNNNATQEMRHSRNINLLLQEQRQAPGVSSLDTNGTNTTPV